MFITDKREYGYKILHNMTVPFGETIGDTIGLFPIAYLNRAVSYSGKRPGVACGNATRDVMPSGKTSWVTHDVLPLDVGIVMEKYTVIFSQIITIVME